jgi:hypothetical protein
MNDHLVCDDVCVIVDTVWYAVPMPDLCCIGKGDIERRIIINLHCEHDDSDSGQLVVARLHDLCQCCYVNSYLRQLNVFIGCSDDAGYCNADAQITA